MRPELKSNYNSFDVRLAAIAAAITLMGTMLVGAETSNDRTELSYGPLAHEFDLTLESGRRQEVVGSLFSADEGEDWRRWAVSPFLRYARDYSLDTQEFDLLYPLITYDRAGGEYKLKILFLTSFAGGANQEEQVAKRFTAFPLVFIQRSPVPEDNYTAFLPFYGQFKNRLQRDKLQFVAWPLYVASWRKGVVTRNYVFPFVHVRSGGGVKGWQIWPFYGQEKKEITTVTDMYGEEQLVPGHRKSFVLWPIHFSQDLGIGTTNEIRHRMVLPFFSYTHSPAKDSRTWLWPLFSVIDNREKGYKEWQMPFPFVVFARGPGETTDRVLPFYSYARSPTHESGFLLWPLYKVNRLKSPPVMRERNRIFFFLYSNVRETNTLRQTVARRIDLWPLFAYRKDHEGNKHFQAPALLESFLPLNHAIAHVYSPVWGVWRSQRNPEKGATSQSFLWNLYRRDRTPKKTKVSLLFGLFQYQSAPEGKRLKLFYIPLSGKGKRAAPADSPPS